MGEKDRLKKVVFFLEINKLNTALEIFNIKNFSEKNVPVKLHMGENKNKYFTKPDFVKQIIDTLKRNSIYPYLFDTTVAYSGLRHSVSGYKELAKLHGFNSGEIGCKVVIDDIGIPIRIENREYEVAEHIYNSTHIFTLSHVKGHIGTGMGGAIKNLGMGGVTKETKIRMHRGSRPLFNDDLCDYCGICAEVCPFNAINVIDEKWMLNIESCFGCGVCIDNCNNEAIKHKDADMQFVLACGAKACVIGKNVIYLNELRRIAKSCDCDPFADPIICPDIGYLISDDPVAIDMASLDLINDIKKDIFFKENNVNPIKQIKYGEEIGLGSSSYQLIEI
jgi:uncharacterized Fe-S center protein